MTVLSKEELDKRDYRKGGLLTEEEKQQVIDLIEQGTPPTRVPEVIHRSKHTVCNTLKHDKQFAADYEIAKRWGFAEAVEEALVGRCLGGMGNRHVTIRSKRKYNGKVALNNPDGTPMMEIVEMTENLYPPDNGALQLWLKANLAERYNIAGKFEISEKIKELDPVEQREAIQNRLNEIQARKIANARPDVPSEPPAALRLAS